MPFLQKLSRFHLARCLRGPTFALCLWSIFPLIRQGVWSQEASDGTATNVSSSSAVRTRGQVIAQARSSFYLHYATWGATDAVTKKDHAVDVTDRVENLLTDPGSFRVDAKTMQADPWPGQSKFLYINYSVAGKDVSIVIRARKEASLERLLVHAGAIPKAGANPAAEGNNADDNSATHRTLPPTGKVQSKSRER